MPNKIEAGSTLLSKKLRSRLIEASENASRPIRMKRSSVKRRFTNRNPEMKQKKFNDPMRDLGKKLGYPLAYCIDTSELNTVKALRQTKIKKIFAINKDPILCEEMRQAIIANGWQDQVEVFEGMASDLYKVKLETPTKVFIVHDGTGTWPTEEPSIYAAFANNTFKDLVMVVNYTKQLTPGGKSDLKRQMTFDHIERTLNKKIIMKEIGRYNQDGLNDYGEYVKGMYMHPLDLRAVDLPESTPSSQDPADAPFA